MKFPENQVSLIDALVNATWIGHNLVYHLWSQNGMSPQLSRVKNLVIGNGRMWFLYSKQRLLTQHVRNFCKWHHVPFPIFGVGPVDKANTIDLVSCPDPTQLTQGRGSGDTSPNPWAMGSLQKLGATNEIAERRSLEYCRSENKYFSHSAEGDVMGFILQHRPICNPTLTITRLQHFRKS